MMNFVPGAFSAMESRFRFRHKGGACVSNSFLEQQTTREPAVNKLPSSSQQPQQHNLALHSNRELVKSWNPFYQFVIENQKRPRALLNNLALLTTPPFRSAPPQLVPHPSGIFRAALPCSSFNFNRGDLDMVLYGYLKDNTSLNAVGHSLSGLRSEELSYGVDRILSGGYSHFKNSNSHLDVTHLELPEGIVLRHTSFAGSIHYGVFCKNKAISKGSRFGPFMGKVVNTSEIKTNDDNSYMWEIFRDGKLSHFIDGRGSSGNWMSYLNCARYSLEQNLVARQIESEIFYEACKDIDPGQELLVWYGDDYLQFMGIPIALRNNTLNSQDTEDVEKGEGFQCERCGKVFAYKYYRDKHLKYTRCVDQGDRKFPCHLCSRIWSN